MDVKDIDIEKINQVENIRLRIENDDVHGLMTSIKHDGLLEPIAVSEVPKKDEYIVVYGNRRLEACKKLGWKTIPSIIKDPNIPIKDFIIKNTSENVVRNAISESEFGRICYMLDTEHHMTNSEIASRFGISKDRVKRAKNIFFNIPEQFRDRVKYNLIGPKRGYIPASTANRIISMKRRHTLSSGDMSILLEEARDDGFSIDHVEIVASLLTRGHNVQKSIRLANKYAMTFVKIPLLKSEIREKKEKYNKPLSRIISEIVSGKIKDTFNVPDWKEDE